MWFEQRLNVKFLVKLEKSGTEVYEMLSKVYGEDTLNPATVYKWVKHFHEGSEGTALMCRVAPLPHVLKMLIRYVCSWSPIDE